MGVKEGGIGGGKKVNQPSQGGRYSAGGRSGCQAGGAVKVVTRSANQAMATTDPLLVGVRGGPGKLNGGCYVDWDISQVV